MYSESLRFGVLIYVKNVYQDSLLLLSHYQIPYNTLFWTSVPEVVTVTYQTLLSSIGPQMVRSLTKLAI